MVIKNNTVERRNPQVILQPEEELHLTKFIVERAADAIFWVDPEAHFLYVNDAGCCLAGYSREELLSMTVRDVDPDFSVKVWSEYWRTIKQQGSLTFESIYQTKQGHSFLLEVNFTYLEYYGKEYGCILIRNITKLKELLGAEDEVRTVGIASRLEKQAILKQWCAAECQRVPEPPSADTATSSVTPKSILPSVPKLREVFDFIEANYHQPITLNDVAQAVGYSPTYLTNLVRCQTGQTVYCWIVERRMAEARSLLLKTDQPVNQIAAAVGYPDAGHFIRYFRKIHDTTPKMWRNMHRS